MMRSVVFFVNLSLRFGSPFALTGNPKGMGRTEDAVWGNLLPHDDLPKLITQRVAQSITL